MKYLSAALYLDNYLYWENRYRETLHQLHILENDDFITAVNLDGMPKSGGISDLGDKYAKREEKLSALRDRLQQLQARLTRCRALVDAAPDETTRRALTAHYLQGKHWKTVADEMGFRCGDTLRKKCLRYLEGRTSNGSQSKS